MKIKGIPTKYQGVQLFFWMGFISLLEFLSHVMTVFKYPTIKLQINQKPKLTSSNCFSAKIMTKTETKHISNTTEKNQTKKPTD